MAKRKRKKWAENKLLSNVFEPDLEPIIQQGATFMKGEWGKKVFGNNHPITLELGCGKGEYTVNLARKYPQRNYIGVDVKGHRFHAGASEANREGLRNAAFLRTRIEFIDAFFGENEVDELWFTFSDPQPGDEKGKRRITSLWYLINKYRKFLKPNARVHIKHDNPLVYELFMEELLATPFVLEEASDDLYGAYFSTLNPDEREILGWRTYYEQMWLDEGRRIHYCRFRIPRWEIQHKPQAKVYSFFENVYDVVRMIPHGRVTNYGAIARYLGSGLSSRMVGWAMNAAHGKDVPAHRVVNRVGVLTGKHHFGDPGRMQWMLEKEGVSVVNDKVVRFKELFWDPAAELR
jgi:tRNA (guanine-N7-)-methyltransferase